MPRFFLEQIAELVHALEQVASATQFAWLREAIGSAVFLVSLVRIVYPLYADWRSTHGGAFIRTGVGPMSYKHACEVALDENLRLGLRAEALERALERCQADVEAARAACEKRCADLREQFALERVSLAQRICDLRAELAQRNERVVGDGLGEAPP